MFSAILILLLLPIVDIGRSRGFQFRTFSKKTFFLFVANFLILMVLGAKHVEYPYIELGQVSTAVYFLHYAPLLYLIALFENTLIDISLSSNTILYKRSIEKLRLNKLK